MTDDVTRTDSGRGTSRLASTELPVVTIAYHTDAARIGTRRVLSGEPLVLGRGSDALGSDALRDSMISRKHISLTARGEEVSVEDLGSHNGTFVNGRKIEREMLEAGDVIEIGQVLLVFHRGPIAYTPPEHPRLVGRSYAMASVLEQIDMVAKEPVSVLVAGETGVGKELVAREVHARSQRTGDFVAINCGALSDGVVHSELFGHVRGAFSGAGQVRTGLVETAAGGTLFLDEIGEASPLLQTSLLRFLEQGEFRPVGADRSSQADVRIVAATNLPLHHAVTAGRFRHDLLGRLERWVIDVPPLRERREDVICIARSLVGKDVTISRDLARALLLHDWPTNVRGLRATIEQAVVECGGTDVLELTPRIGKRLDVPATPPSSKPATPLKKRPRRPEADELRRIFADAGYSVTTLAERLGVSRNTLYRWFYLAGLDPGTLRDG